VTPFDLIEPKLVFPESKMECKSGKECDWPSKFKQRRVEKTASSKSFATPLFILFLSGRLANKVQAGNYFLLGRFLH